MGSQGQAVAWRPTPSLPLLPCPPPPPPAGPSADYLGLDRLSRDSGVDIYVWPQPLSPRDALNLLLHTCGPPEREEAVPVAIPNARAVLEQADNRTSPPPNPPGTPPTLRPNLGASCGTLELPDPDLTIGKKMKICGRNN